MGLLCLTIRPSTRQVDRLLLPPRVIFRQAGTLDLHDADAGRWSSPTYSVQLSERITMLKLLTLSQLHAIDHSTLLASDNKHRSSLHPATTIQPQQGSQEVALTTPYSEDITRIKTRQGTYSFEGTNHSTFSRSIHSSFPSDQVDSFCHTSLLLGADTNLSSGW